jgi:ABC-type uncharacterized transport system substrate-binding protein
MKQSTAANHHLIGGILGLLCASTLHAHPHYWIDVSTKWHFDRAGMITGVTLTWLFDDYYSVLLASDAASSNKSRQSVLEDIMAGTAEHHYFLSIEQHGAPTPLGMAEQSRIGARDYRIEIAFHLPLAAALDPRQGDVVYRIAEPTYFFEMLHAEDIRAITLDDAPANCRYSLEPPRPDAALVAYASSLGINESGGNELGIQFAETVSIRCE